MMTPTDLDVLFAQRCSPAADARAPRRHPRPGHTRPAQPPRNTLAGIVRPNAPRHA